jgi:hypothetical protein
VFQHGLAGSDEDQFGAGAGDRPDKHRVGARCGSATPDSRSSSASDATSVGSSGAIHSMSVDDG